jgi:hypothetical protein
MKTIQGNRRPLSARSELGVAYWPVATGPSVFHKIFSRRVGQEHLLRFAERAAQQLEARSQVQELRTEN